MRFPTIGVLVLAIGACRGGGEVAAYPMTTRVLAALRDDRPFQLRLSSNAAFRDCAPPDMALELPTITCRVAGATAAGRLVPLSSEVTAALKATVTTDALWASALIELGTGAPERRQVDRAILRLREVVARDSSQALAWSHLAIAHALRAPQAEDARDLFAALDFIERAATRDSTSPVIAFNRAWLRSTVGVQRSARSAWEAAIASERDAEWIAVSRAAREPTLVGGRPSLSLTEVGISGDPQGARAFVFDSLLYRWSTATGAGDSVVVRTSLDSARLVARTLLRAFGDSSLHRVTAELEGGTVRASDVAAYVDGVRAYRRTEYARALPMLESARKGFRVSRASGLFDWSSVSLGATRMANLEHEAAAKLLDSVKARAGARGDLALSAMAAWAGSLAYARGGRHDTGEALVVGSEQTFKSIGELGNAATMATMASDIQSRLGRSREAAASALRGFRASVRAGGAPRYEDLLGMAQQLTDAGLNHAAALLLDEALLAAQPLGRPKDAPEALSRLALVQLAQGRQAAAERSIARARELVGGISDRLMQARIQAELDRAEGRVRAPVDPASALTFFSRSLAFFATIPADAMRLHMSAAEVALANGDTVRAVQDLGASIELARGLAPTATPFAARQLNAVVRDAQRQSIALALARGDTIRAFDLTLALPRLDVLGPSREKQPSSPLPSGRGELRFVVLADEVLSWARAGAARTLARHRVERGVLGEELLRYLNVLRAGEDTAAITTMGREWFGRFLSAHARTLAGIQRLNIYPDGALGDLPVAALVDDEGRYVGDRFEVVTVVPSSLRRNGGKIRSAVPLLVGNPAWRRSDHPGLEPLRWADEEIRLVGAQHPEKTVLSGADATREALLREMPRHEVIHFAGHSRVVIENPGRSHLVLAAGATFGDGVLYAEDIAKLDLRGVKLVVLSSCGRSRDDAGSLGDINALALAFLDAGVQHVVASQWEAADLPSGTSRDSARPQVPGSLRLTFTRQ